MYIRLQIDGVLHKTELDVGVIYQVFILTYRVNSWQYLQIYMYTTFVDTCIDMSTEYQMKREFVCISNMNYFCFISSIYCFLATKRTTHITRYV